MGHTVKVMKRKSAYNSDLMLLQMIQQMWPYIGDYANQIMKDIVEPSVRDNLPSSLKSFMFEKCDLGDIVSYTAVRK